MDGIVSFFDFVRILVWSGFDLYHDRFQREYDRINRLTPTHERQRDDAERLYLHHRHHSITGLRNQRPAAAVQRHQQRAEEEEDQLNRMTQLLSYNRLRVRSLRFGMAALRVLQFCWAFFLFSAGLFVLSLMFGVGLTDCFIFIDYD